MRKRARLIAVVGAFAVVAAACGGDDRGSGPEGDGGGGSATTVEAAASGFGDLESPCGPGDGGGATDQGVTANSIQIGYGDDAGFPSSPGLNKEMSDAVAAMIEWCNEQGGINGRQIDGTYYDARITEVNNVMTEACEREFFLVGEGWSLDASQEQTRRGCGLPAVPGYAVSPQFSNAPLKFEAFPIPADYTNAGPGAQVAELFPEEVKRSAIVYANYSATIDSKDKVVSAYPSVGWEFLDCPQEYNIGGEADWKPFMTNLKNCGAEVVYFVGSPNPNFRNVLEAAAQVDYEPVWVVDTNFYDEAFRDWNAAGYGDNVYMRLSYIPFEEASENPATQQYLDMIDEVGGKRGLLGMQATSAFLLWATAAKACGADLTRQCVIDELSKVTEWTGGGLHSSGNPGENLPSDCSILVKLTGTTYERVLPEEPGTYGCDPSYAAATSGPVLERANLDADRISQL